MRRGSSAFPAILTFAAATALGMALASARIGTRRGRVPAPGRSKRPMTRILETGAHLLQGKWPLEDFEIYMVGFHPAKDDPEMQCEAHHFCRQVTEDFAECVLFDGNAGDANLIGVEYIISEHLFERLPEAERPFWHPHNGEILSGQLQAPGLPEAAEHAFMRAKMNSYGKTWHLWDTGGTHGKGKELPYGEPMLMWSFNRLGEAREWLIRQRDSRLGLDTEGMRRARQDLMALAHPQEGVDALKGRYDRPTQDIPAVRDKKALVPH